MTSFVTQRITHLGTVARPNSLKTCTALKLSARRSAQARLAQGRPWNIHMKAVETGSTGTNDFVQNAPSDTASVVSAESVKAALLDAICGTDRGLVARSEVRAELNELINQLEVRGGHGSDISSAEFAGTWELVYSNAADLLLLLSISKLPLPVRIGAVRQTINAANSTVENSVQLEFPLVHTSVSTVSSYNIASPKRLQFTVQRGILHTPSIEGNLELPASITVLGQTLDLALLRDALAPLTRGAASLAASASDLLGQAPNLEVPLQTQTWQLTTYLDSTLRITRGDGGTVYVFKKVAAPSK
ncbi:hypothetical protein VOLCADRAFT_104724 [Volvox carteri f. nagariensis]|uniref:Plastid lipid-associated protein/fibrillin conserved domain-containing protein n=1 Tax=Volvox carteri f. nagariensis TaxID=3068 RepID=D8TVA1_VOLCA|nr:uncharacterized protein VOLCADRAFT_104724 [Volvox carteri f. nagariensis]EFJ48668.1 hypothetical protein VOLCADRAFT_104724 [Volvox carteri f. nagariensis]|eukprot:XP_002950467.1 hypothetical protein VOLCADRAFT_104724 [Volvox carteri f. nagariensis]